MCCPHREATKRIPVLFAFTGSFFWGLHVNSLIGAAGSPVIALRTGHGSGFFGSCSWPVSPPGICRVPCLMLRSPNNRGRRFSEPRMKADQIRLSSDQTQDRRCPGQFAKGSTWGVGRLSALTTSRPRGTGVPSSLRRWLCTHNLGASGSLGA